MSDFLSYAPGAVLIPFGVALMLLRQSPGEDETIRRWIANLFGVLLIVIGLLWLLLDYFPRF